MRTGYGALDPQRPKDLTALLGRTVTELDTEAAPIAGLGRVRAIRFADGAQLVLPAGNRLRTGGDIAELRALLAGWPRDSAARLKTFVGAAAPAAALARIEAVLDAWAVEPELATTGADRWPAAAPAPGAPFAPDEGS